MADEMNLVHISLKPDVIRTRLNTLDGNLDGNGGKGGGRLNTTPTPQREKNRRQHVPYKLKMIKFNRSFTCVHLSANAC